MKDQDADGSDESLFLEAMRDVAPVDKGRKQARKISSTDTPGHKQRREDASGTTKDTVDPNFLTLGEVKPIDPLAHIEWKKDGVQNAVFEKLRRGGYAIEASLDLHRKTVKEARHMVFNFLNAMSARDQRMSLVLPGKGELSETPGRLKSYVTHWLAEHSEVIAYCSAQKHHGGVGAFYVLLRKSKESSEQNKELHEKRF